jgi:predicted regulator of Ras-like GTPase activity (Roadblock/LC7/MglB family)
MGLNTYDLQEDSILQVKQLIYTSFQKRGFALLTSRNVPLLVQQSFTQKLVQTFWDPYLPPTSDYRAGYLFQMPLETPGTLFGWLYHDGCDEIGRSDIPYFIAYYLPGTLHPIQLSAVLTCLEHGPISWIDRHKPLTDLTLEYLTIENARNSQSMRQGVAVPTAIRVQSYEAMHSHVLIDYFFANIADQQSLVTPQSDPQNPLAEHRLKEGIEHQKEGVFMNTQDIEDILQDLISKPIGIYGAALVSSDGLAIIKPIGIDENSSGMLAGTMIYLAQTTRSELNWHEIELISIRASEGYLILSRCNADIYLLIQSRKVPVGLLEGEINQTITKLRSAFNPVDDADNIVQAALPPQNYIPLRNDIEEPLDFTDEVTYRGRRASS